MPHPKAATARDPHDHSTPGNHAKVKVVVRPGARLNSSRPGDLVTLDASELEIAAIKAAVCTPEEYTEIVSARPAVKAPAEPPPNLVGNAIREGLARIQASAAAAAEKAKAVIAAIPTPPTAP